MCLALGLSKIMEIYAGNVEIIANSKIMQIYVDNVEKIANSKIMQIYVDNVGKIADFVNPFPRFELPLNMNSLSDLGPVDFLSRYNLIIMAIMKRSLR